MLRNLLTKTPAEISSAIRAVIYVLVLFETVRWSEPQIAGLLLALEAVLYLFTTKSTVPTQYVRDAGTTPAKIYDAAASQTDNTRETQVMVSMTESTAAGLAATPETHPADWRVPPHIPVMAIALALTGLVGCGQQNVTTTPDQTAIRVATYGEQAVRLVEEVQKAVNQYTVNQGGRTPETDRVSEAIRDRVIPVAQNLETQLKRYQAIRNTGAVPDLSDVESVRQALTRYEQVVEAVLKTDLPEDLPSSVATTLSEITKLITNIRNLLNQPSALRFHAVPVAA